MPRITALKYPGVTPPVQVRPGAVITLRDLAVLSASYRMAP